MENNAQQTQQPVKKTKILNYINVFRGLAILLIVAGHTMQFGEIGSLTQKISVEVFAGGTALFIFISGFLFHYAEQGTFRYLFYPEYCLRHESANLA